MKITKYDDPHSCLDVELDEENTRARTHTHTKRANRDHQNSLQLSVLIQ